LETKTIISQKKTQKQKPKKQPIAAQTANTGWEQEELGGIYLCQPGREYARKTCNLLQAYNERAKIMCQPRSQLST
jgi:hypothetical protein